jgi:DNA polymerase-3 subunit delta'
MDSNNIYPWHEKSWNNFFRARETNHLPHAILLAGENGIGKQALADRMSKSLLCMQPIDQQACNHCQSCRTYDSGANPDYIKIELLEDKQQIGVDQIRRLSEFLNYSRSFNTYRVVLLDPVERMNQNAANSLLKSLEEPSRNTVIILIASQLSKILPTIKSRCQLFSLPTPNYEESLCWLKKHYPDIENSELHLQMAFGKPLKSIEIKAKDIENREALADDILGVITSKQAVTDIAKKWEKSDHNTLLNWQIFWLQEYLKESACGHAYPNKNTNLFSDKYSQTLQSIAEQISIEQKWHLYQQLIAQKQLIHTSVNALMFLENMIMLWLMASKS